MKAIGTIFHSQFDRKQVNEYCLAILASNNEKKLCSLNNHHQLMQIKYLQNTVDITIQNK